MNLKHFSSKYMQLAFFILLYLVLSFIAIRFSFHNQIVFEGNDINFHLNRVLGLENIFQSPVNLETYNGVASQVNNFYGWLTVYPMYLFMRLFNNIGFGYNFYMFLLTFVTFGTAHYATFSITKNNRTAFIGAVLYGFSTYRFVNVITRSALGEAIGMAFLPLIFLGVYLIFQKNKHGIFPLVIGSTLLLYSHVITAFMAVLFILLCFVLYCIMNRNNILPVILLFVQSGFLILLLSLGFLVPLLSSYLYQDLSMPGLSDLASASLASGSYLLIEGINNSLINVTIGVILTSLFIIMVVRFTSLEKIQQISLLLGAFAFLLASKLFPWDIFQNTPLNTIQFPWRFLGLTTLFVSFAAAIYLNKLIESIQKRRLATIIFLGLILLVSSSSIRSSINGLNHSNYSQFNLNNITQSFSVVQVDYSPVHTDAETTQIGEKYLTVNGVATESEITRSANKQTYIFNTDSEAEVVLPVFKYQGLHLTNNGQEIDYDENSALITFDSGTGVNQVEVSYDYPLTSKIAWGISIVSLLLLVVAKIIWGYKKKATNHSVNNLTDF